MGGSGRVVLEEAFLLHRRSYRETSLLLEVLTRNHGRVALLGKGTRRNKRATAALLFPFVPLQMSWAGRGDLPVLTSVECDTAMPLTQPRALTCGLYLNELILRLLAPHDPHPGVFDLYAQTVGRLTAGGEHETALRQFEVLLLAELGYALPLECDSDSGDGLVPERYYRYVPEHGPVEVAARADAVRGSALIALRTGVFSDVSDLRDAKRLMRSVITHHLGERPLKSRELFKYSQT